MGHISSPPFPVGPPRGASSWTATVWYSRNLGPFPGNHCHVPCGHSLLFPRLVVSRQGSVVVSLCFEPGCYRGAWRPFGGRAGYCNYMFPYCLSLLFCLLCHFLMRIPFRRVCEYSMFAHFTMKFHAVNETSNDLPSAVRFLKIFMEWVYFVFSTIRTEPTTSYLFCLIFASLFLTKNMQFL